MLLALILVAAPDLVFLVSHLANALMIAACIVLAGLALALVARDIGSTRAPLDRGLLAICLCLGFVLCLLGGEAHVFFATDDWLIRDAVLGDLVSHPWPVGYEYLGDQTVLRAPLGLYLVPAAIGKSFGLHAAHAALLVQNSVLFGCILYTFAASAEPRLRALWLIAVFIIFSGWDIVGEIMLGKTLAFGTRLPFWAGRLQYSSNVEQLFWAPNHALSGWMFVAAYLAWRREQIAATSLLVVFGLCAFWSPLSMIGALPFAANALFSEARRGRLTWRGVFTLASAAVALFPIALYLAADSARVAHGTEHFGSDFVIDYLVFLCVEILPFILIVALLRPRSWAASRQHEIRPVDMAIATVILLAAPLIKVGGTDFMMRASIPALSLLALCVASTAIPAIGRPARGALSASFIALAVGFVSPLYEVGRALTYPAFAISDCNMLTAARFPPNDGTLYHYVARVDRVAATTLFKTPEQWLRADRERATCWPGRVEFRG